MKMEKRIRIIVLIVFLVVEFITPVNYISEVFAEDDFSVTEETTE